MGMGRTQIGKSAKRQIGQVGKKRAARRKPARCGVVKARAQLPLKQERTAVAFVGDAKGNKAEAMRKGGYKRSTAEKQQKRTFDNPKVQRRIEDLLTEKGLTDERVVAKHSDLIDAKVTKYYQALSLGDHTDNDTQLRAVELFYKLTGKLKDRVEIEVAAKAWSERIALVIQRCACSKCKSILFDAIVGELSAPSVG